MGAEFNFQKLKATNAADAKQEGEALIEQAAYEHGHGGYTGSWCCGVEVRREVLSFHAATVNTTGAGAATTRPNPTIDSVAEDWLWERTEKWGPMLIVQAGEHFYAGANCSC